VLRRTNNHEVIKKQVIKTPRQLKINFLPDIFTHDIRTC